MLQIAIAEQVKRPVLRSGPNRIYLTLLAILFSAAGGYALAFVLDRLDPTFRTPEEVIECLEIPVVVSVFKS
jgi:capsular polysaccharide biosynthesis protein